MTTAPPQVDDLVRGAAPRRRRPPRRARRGRAPSRPDTRLPESSSVQIQPFCSSIVTAGSTLTRSALPARRRNRSIVGARASPRHRRELHEEAQVGAGRADRCAWSGRLRRWRAWQRRSRRSTPQCSRSPGSTRGRTTTAGGRRRTTPDGCTCRRCSATRCRRPTRRTSSATRPVPQIVAGLVRDGYNMIFGTLVRDVRARRQRPALRRSIRRCCSSRRPALQVKPNQSEYFGAAEDTIYLSGMAAGRGDQEGRDRLRGALRHPRGRPTPQRLHARRAGDAPGREGEDRLDERVVLAAEGDRRREGARLRRRRRARPERRQPRRRRLRREGRDPVGRLRLRREEVRAEAVADRRGLQLGPVLPRAGSRRR